MWAKPLRLRLGRYENEAFESPDAVREMELLMDVIRSVRNIRAEVNVPMSKKIELLVKTG